MKTKLYYLFLAVMWWLLGTGGKEKEYETSKSKN